MRVSKKALRPFAVILVSLSMSALLTGCQTSSDSASQAVGGSDAESTIQQQTTDASNSETNEQNGSNETVASLPQVFVTDVEGNRRNLSDFPWAAEISDSAGRHRKRHPDRLCILHDSLRKSESKGRKPDVRLLR